ncbi:MAG: IS110 family transposase [Actinobacteria bacterium]|nr:IS110 family transposase [Actinomycetota bacterium]
MANTIKKRKEPVMKEKIYVGIDLAKGDSKVAVVDDSGEAIFKPFNITNSKEGIKKLLSKLSSYKTGQIVCGMEVSSNYWENMCSYLKEKDVTPILLNPYQVKKYRQAMGFKIKTDPIDATAIAGLICGRKYESLYISDDSMMELRELVRIKYSFQRRVKDLKKSVLSLLYLVFPEYTKIISHPFSKVSMHILSKYPTSCHMAKASVSKLVKIFRRYQGCNFNLDKAKDLISAAKDSFYSGKAFRSRGMTITMQLDEISSLSLKIKDIEDEIKSILDPEDPSGGSSDYDILNSIKGVGIGTIATFKGYVGDVSRFSSSDKLISFIGFYPNIFESGRYRKKNPTIQKAGPKELRYMLYLSSVACIKHNSQLRKYYHDNVSAGMPAKKAIIKVAVKLARMMYSMLKHKTKYESSKVFMQSLPLKKAA